MLSPTAEGDPGRLYECRDCGTSVSQEADVCPSCGSGEIASYRFD